MRTFDWFEREFHRTKISSNMFRDDHIFWIESLLPLVFDRIDFVVPRYLPRRQDFVRVLDIEKNDHIPQNFLSFESNPIEESQHDLVELHSHPWWIMRMIISIRSDETYIENIRCTFGKISRGEINIFIREFSCHGFQNISEMRTVNRCRTLEKNFDRKSERF